LVDTEEAYSVLQLVANLS
jgi:hypothetical protein